MENFDKQATMQQQIREDQQQIMDDTIDLLSNIKHSLNDFLEQCGTFDNSEGYSKYLVSDLGFVLNKKTHTLLHFKVMRDGHEKVMITDDIGKRSWYPVRLLVAKTFLPNDNNLNDVEHIDGDMTNNEVSNLRWV